ncbi:DUF3240 family protein [Ectothiorhodospira shaposhnikovii]|uniref:DUF3240 family protein n=1 Tax=Ectothiorhodospira shaposhnikovii TaxID=1054 RepID=UPI0023E820F0|nr:DUF3240 family protein [Ectothiorhodospira shaposhnikovii]
MKTHPSFKRVSLNVLLPLCLVLASTATSADHTGSGDSGGPMTLAEQVSGYTSRTMFLIHLPPETLQTLLTDLGRDFSGSGIHHWRVPVLDQGRL